jgi:hypothetical protein
MTTTVNPPAFVLSATLRAHGFNLTDEQALLLDVAQKMHNGFKERTPIPVRMLKRILQAYHSVPMAESKAIMQELEDIGLVELLTNANERHDIKLVPKFRGLSDEELTEENAGIGVQVQTLREQASKFQFRNNLLNKANCGLWQKSLDCTVAAAMLLAVFKENCFINQMKVDDLRKACRAAAISDLEFSCGCAELNGMEFLFFYWCEKAGIGYAQTMDDIGKQYEVDVADALTPHETVSE